MTRTFVNDGQAVMAESDDGPRLRATHFPLCCRLYNHRGMETVGCCGESERAERTQRVSNAALNAAHRTRLCTTRHLVTQYSFETAHMYRRANARKEQNSPKRWSPEVSDDSSEKRK